MSSIFDFDQTLSIEHTFSEHCIEETMHSSADQYTVGKNDGKRNLKKNAKDYLKHDDQNLSAIATYHNNPEYVAGYIAILLKKELKCVRTIKSKDEPVVAINMYQVEGLDKYFLISYLPHQDDKFQETMDALGNKNKQIEFIRQVWLEMDLIKADTIIDFFDDSGTNFRGAKELSYINGHRVDDETDGFKIIESYQASLVPETVKDSLKPVKEKEIAPAKLNDMAHLISSMNFENRFFHRCLIRDNNKEVIASTRLSESCPF